MRWVLATVAPWALSAGLLVSFTATAGQDANPGATSVIRLAPSIMSDLAEGPSLLTAASAFDMPGLNLTSLLHAARLPLDGPDRYEPLPQPDLRADLKSFASAFPQVERDRKGDPIITLRPTMTRTDHGVRQVVIRELASLFAIPADHRGAASGFSDDAVPHRSAPPVGFEFQAPPVPAEPAEPHLTLDIEADAMERATPILARSPELYWQDAPEAEPQDDLMQTASTGNLAGGGTTIVQKAAQPRSRFAGLIAPVQQEREMRCLAEAIYFESRSESERGQAAVAQVVLNRAQSGLYPPTVCGVVYQNRHRYLACQFTFACEGKSLRINEPEPWRVAVQIASDVVSGKTYLADVGASTHYHAQYVRPYWAKRLRKMDVIGTHVFYQLRPGQT